MAARVPRLVLFAFAAVLATAGLTYAASQKLASTPSASSSAPLVQQRTELTVPDVRNQAFVFAKGALQDAGFAWRVTGAVHGYAANRVATQSPPPGTRVYDTGAPVVTLTLVRNAHYPQTGSPEDVSPYHATATEVADAASQPIAPAPTTSTTPSTTTPPTTTPASTVPAATTPTATTPTTPTNPAYPTAPTPSSSADHAAVSHAEHATAPAAAPVAPKPVAPKAAVSRYPQNRPPAFAVAGAPKEPLDEMPLDMRARTLEQWLAAHPAPSNANVKHWLYQNDWIVTGARFGWWHGAQALAILIRVDERTQALWGIGAKSEAVARGALAEVEARSR